MAVSVRLQLDGADLLALLPEPTAVLDDRGRIVAANGALAAVLGRDDLGGRELVEVVVDDAAVVHAARSEWARSAELTPAALAFDTPDGPRVLRCTGAALGRGGSVLLRVEPAWDECAPVPHDSRHLLAELRTRRATEERLLRIAFHDPVTDTLNRAGLDERLAAVVHRDERVIVAYVDLDRFKVINDVFGHDAGDEALREAARRLGGALRPDDLVARIGGDEFVAVLGEVDPGRGPVIGRRLVEALGETFRLRGEHVELGGSVGIAERRPREGAAELLRRADAAMYRAKRAGGNRVEVAELA